MRKSPNTAADETGVARERPSCRWRWRFRNGPIEDVHAGKNCPTCHGDSQFSDITQAEMRRIMKAAVDRLYTSLLLKEHDQVKYEELLKLGERYTARWDEPA